MKKIREFLKIILELLDEKNPKIFKNYSRLLWNFYSRCKNCGEVFNVPYLYEKHLATAHGNRNSPQGNSSVSYRPLPNSDIFINLAATTNTGQLKCLICDQRCETASELTHHKLTHCKITQADSCSMCRGPLHTVEDYYRHVQRHFPASAVNISCVICKQSITGSAELQAHSTFHLGWTQRPKSVRTKFLFLNFFFSFFILVLFL